MQCLIAIAFIIGAILVVGALTWGVVALFRKGGRPHGTSGQLGHAMQNLEGLFVESKKHVIEVQQDEHSDEEESGDPPEK